jgi:hypothetical protein
MIRVTTQEAGLVVGPRGDLQRVAPCGIHSMAITETGPSRSPKPRDGDHRNRFIAIGGPANLA